MRDARLSRQCGIGRRRRPADRFLDRARIGQLLTRDDITLRERALWRMLYETAARSAKVEPVHDWREHRSAR